MPEKNFGFIACPDLIHNWIPLSYHHSFIVIFFYLNYFNLNLCVSVGFPLVSSKLTLYHSDYFLQFWYKHWPLFWSICFLCFIVYFLFSNFLFKRFHVFSGLSEYLSFFIHPFCFIFEFYFSYSWFRTTSVLCPIPQSGWLYNMNMKCLFYSPSELVRTLHRLYIYIYVRERERERERERVFTVKPLKKRKYIAHKIAKQ